MARRSTFRARFAAIAALHALALSGAAGCEDRLFHAFDAYPYDPHGDCLGAPEAIDVLDGPDPGKCPDLRCWKGPDGTFYVTDAACDAPLDFEDRTSDAEGPCVGALAAYARPNHGRCGLETKDGG